MAKFKHHLGKSKSFFFLKSVFQKFSCFSPISGNHQSSAKMLRVQLGSSQRTGETNTQIGMKKLLQSICVEGKAMTIESNNGSSKFFKI